MRIPRTVVAHDDASLRDAIAEFPSYFARAACSRGGVALLTNSGPLAGAVAVEDCHPTAEQPWLVQEYVSGPMVCSYSTLHEGRVTAHCTYRAPRQWEHSTGISFLGVDGTTTLDVVRRFAEPIAYTGQLSFDCVERDGELFLIECNPRSIDGVLLMTAEHLALGLTDPTAATSMVEPGTEVQLRAHRRIGARPHADPPRRSDGLRSRRRRGERAPADRATAREPGGDGARAQRAGAQPPETTA